MPPPVVLSTALAAAGFFPIGIYGVPDGAPLALLADAGFTSLLPASREPASQLALALEARSHGLQVIAHPDGVFTSSVPPASWPVGGWYLQDEPEVNRVSSGALAASYARLKAWDPARPAVVVFGEGSAAKAYCASMDELWIDWYPVPHLPLESVGREVARVRDACPGKSVRAVIQAMDWRDYPQRDPSRPRIGRFPSRGEMWFMALDAIVNGADGLYFFELRRRGVPGRTLFDDPGHWSDLRAVAGALAALRDLLAFPSNAGREGDVKFRRFEADGESLFIAVNEGGAPAVPGGPLPARALPPRTAAVYRLKGYRVLEEVQIP